MWDYCGFYLNLSVSVNAPITNLKQAKTQWFTAMTQHPFCLLSKTVHKSSAFTGTCTGFGWAQILDANLVFHQYPSRELVPGPIPASPRGQHNSQLLEPHHRPCVPSGCTSMGPTSADSINCRPCTVLPICSWVNRYMQNPQIPIHGYWGPTVSVGKFKQLLLLLMVPAGLNQNAQSLALIRAVETEPHTWHWLAAPHILIQK